jgi:signal transduction histidine kinase
LEQIGDDWQINFADTGPGMSRQLVEKIFEPFQSQFEGGTGLGLAIVYQIVQAHEGKVWARSKVGEGSVFVLRLRRMAVAEGVSEERRVAKMPTSAPAGESIAAAAGIGGRAHG